METAKQVSIFLENKPGRMVNVLRALERQKVNVTGLTIMDSHEHSVLRLVTSDLDKTRQTLKDLNAQFTETEVLLVELRNQPGALAHVCEQMAGEHINIDYCYVSSGGRNGKVFGIFKVSNADKAAKLLNGAANNVAKKKAQKRPLRDKRAYSGLD